MITIIANGKVMLSEEEIKFAWNLLKEEIEKEENTGKNVVALKYITNTTKILFKENKYINDIEKIINEIINKKNAQKKYSSVYIYISNATNEKKFEEFKSNPNIQAQNKEKNRLEQAEKLIKKWSCTNIVNTPKTQNLLNINRYYDFYTGMTPYVEIYFRTGCKKGKNNAYEAVWTSINSIEHPFISNVNIKDNGVKTVTIELYDKDFASYSYFAIRKEGSFLNKGTINKDYYSLDQLIKAALRNELSSNINDYKETSDNEEIKNALKQKTYSTTYINIVSKKQETLIISYDDNIDYKLRYLQRKGEINDEDVSRIKKEYTDWKNTIVIKKDDWYINDEIAKKESNVSEEETKLDANYIKMIDDSNNSLLSATNLKIRFGYADYNTPMTEEKLQKYFSSKGIEVKSEEGKLTRSARWWSVSKDYGEEWSVRLKTWIDDDGNICTSNNDDNERTVNSEKRNIGEYKEDLSVKSHMNSVDQTTQISRDIELMITGYKTTLTATGIKYTLTCIESKEANIMKKRMLQRFSEINDYPEGVLYDLMRMFNEYGGEPLKNKNIKIVFMEDENDKNFITKNLLVQKYDLNNLTEEERKKILYTDTYNALINGGEIDPTKLAKISLKFGTEEAMSNYMKIADRPPLTKSIAALMNEFCAACPPKKLEKTVKKIYNENGEEVNIDPSEQMARPLKWFTVVDTGSKRKTTYIVFYYRKELKPSKIRQYSWGPNLPYNSCVKQINIENKSEFALLSSVRTFNSANGTVQNRINNNNLDIDSTTDSETATLKTKVDEILNKKNKNEYDLIADSDVTGMAYDIALSSGVYEGTMEILGDPFFLFNGIMQPCTYPIKLNVIVPKNETEMRAKDEKLKEKHNLLGTGNDIANGTQRLHEMSGYYLIKEIEHNITPDGFTTKLGILSYPNLAKQILIDNVNPIELGKNY